MVKVLPVLQLVLDTRLLTKMF